MTSHSKSPQAIQYIRYIDEHRKRVALAWNQIKQVFRDSNAPFISDKDGVQKVELLIQTHDGSKYTDAEFEPYRLHWYPAPGEEPNERAYNQAWRHHKMVNPHHYEYWKGREFEMSKDWPFLVEMCCDWMSVSRLTGEVPAYEWFQENKEEISKYLPGGALVFLDYVLYKMYTATGV